MCKSKLFLLIAAACLAAGLLLLTGIIPVGGAASAYVTFPVGGVFLGMYLIWRAFERESAQFDQTGHSPSADENKAPCCHSKCGCHEAARQ